MKRLITLKMTLATAMVLTMASALGDDVMPTEDNLARWAEAYTTIKSMEPKWAAQGPEAFNASSEAGVPIFYLDVRTEEEQSLGYIDGATLVSLTRLPTVEGIAALPEDKSTIMAVYCKSGHRSSLALPLLHQLGYTNAISMKGGYMAWSEAGYPVTCMAAPEETEEAEQIGDTEAVPCG